MPKSIKSRSVKSSAERAKFGRNRKRKKTCVWPFSVRQAEDGREDGEDVCNGGVVWLWNGDNDDEAVYNNLTTRRAPRDDNRGAFRCHIRLGTAK